MADEVAHTSSNVAVPAYELLDTLSSAVMISPATGDGVGKAVTKFAVQCMYTPVPVNK